MQDVQAAKLDQVKAIIAPALANGPIEITMVGDVSVDQATKAVAATFGALPRRSGAPMAPPLAGEVKFPAPTAQPVVLRHAGRADQGVAAIAWQTTDVFADSESAARRVVTDILQFRLMEQLRIKFGATYSPSADGQCLAHIPGYGYIAAYAEIPPDKAQLFFDTVKQVTADLGAHEPSADEFERARRPELDTLEKAVETNNYWLGALGGRANRRAASEAGPRCASRLEKVTPADVQRVARKYLTDERAWKLIVARSRKHV